MSHDDRDCSLLMVPLSAQKRPRDGVHRGARTREIGWSISFRGGLQRRVSQHCQPPVLHFLLRPTGDLVYSA